jgi:hypothetical protein
MPLEQYRELHILRGCVHAFKMVTAIQKLSSAFKPLEYN